MRSQPPAESFRIAGFAVAVLIAVLAPCVHAQPFTLATTPAPPLRDQPYTLSISGAFPGGFLFGKAAIETQGNSILVRLPGSCALQCAAPAPNGVTLAMPSLGPGTYDLAVTLQGEVNASLHAAVTVAGPANYQGLWWKSPPGSEPGWGVNLAQQGNTLFAAWFTYDAAGHATWLVMPGGVRAADGSYSGTLYRSDGSSSGAAGVQPAPARLLTEAGAATFTFSDDSNGTFAYRVDGVSQAKAITRQLFSKPSPVCAASGLVRDVNYTDLWWADPAFGAEPGWGLAVAHQGSTLFAVLFAYDASGRATWLAMPELKPVLDFFEGALYRASGPPFSATPWNAAAVSVAPVGNAVLAFLTRDQGTFSYSADGALAIARPIARQVFANPQTTCN